MSSTLDREELIELIHNQHKKIVETLSEELQVWAKDREGEDKLLISTGLKVEDNETGLTYTVVGASTADDDNIIVSLEKPQGGIINVTVNDLQKNYKRL